MTLEFTKVTWLNLNVSLILKDFAERYSKRRSVLGVLACYDSLSPTDLRSIKLAPMQSQIYSAKIVWNPNKTTFQRTENTGDAALHVISRLSSNPFTILASILRRPRGLLRYDLPSFFRPAILLMAAHTQAAPRPTEVSTSDVPLTMPSSRPAPGKRKLTGRAFYESIGSPKLVLAPMVEQSDFVCLGHQQSRSHR